MIRPATFVAMLIFVFAGLFLYQTKHRSQMLDREIARTMKATDETRARGTLLRAEYALLNDPDRLRELSDQLLKLRPTAPTQFTTLADLPKRLPAVGAPAAEPEAVAEPAPVAAVPAPVAAAAPAAAARPVVQAAAVPTPRALAPVRPASVTPTVAATPVTQTGPVTQAGAVTLVSAPAVSVRPAMRSTLGSAVRPVEAAAEPARVPAHPAPAPSGGSALGMARMAVNEPHG